MDYGRSRRNKPARIQLKLQSGNARMQSDVVRLQDRHGRCVILVWAATSVTIVPRVSGENLPCHAK